MLHRRDAMIRLGQLGVGGLALPSLLRARASSSLRHPTADSCIYIFLWGGPPQQDTWDMKPDAPEGIRSPFGIIDTAVPGIRISDQMQKVPQQDLRQVEGQNAFFIIPASVKGSFKTLFATHPPLEARIARLQQLENQLQAAA